MEQSLLSNIDPALVSSILFVGCVLLVTVGHRLRQRFVHENEQESRGGVGVGALLGLWALVLGFTFSSSASRFETIRTMMVEEANIIRTVLFRSEAFPDGIRSGFLDDLREYLQARIDYYDHAEDRTRFNKARQDVVEIGRSLWTRTMNASTVPSLTGAGNNMSVALTSMFDVAAKRDALLSAGMPDLISYILFVLALIVSFVGGFTTPVIRAKEWIVIVAFIFLSCVIIFMTLDLGSPMTGFVKPDVGAARIRQIQELF